MNVGDYVRIKNKGVKKIIALYENAIFDGRNRIEENQIIKSSPNIIDLIEVGDYVNGYKIINKNKCTLYIEDYADEDSYLYISQQNIKSIVTKEQFESMKYKVGE